MGFLDFIPVVGPAISAISSIGTNIANKQMNDDNNRTQMELAKYNWDKQIDFWHKQNEYNSPSAQMQRFADAGLNPNLMYGQGTNGNSSFSPSADMPKTNAYRFDNALGNASMMFAQLELQRKSVDSDARLKDSQAMTEASKRIQMEIQNNYTEQQRISIEIDNAYKSNVNPTRIKQLEQEFDNLKTQGSILREQQNSLILSNERYEQLTPIVVSQEAQQLENLIKTGKQIDANTAAAAASAALSRAQALTEAEKTYAQQLANKIAEYDVGVAAATQQAKVDSIRYATVSLYNDLKIKKTELENKHLSNQVIRTQLYKYYVDALRHRYNNIFGSDKDVENQVNSLVDAVVFGPRAAAGAAANAALSR